jgi:hypothetical protein
MKSLKNVNHVAQQIINMDETEVFLRKDNAKTGNKERQANNFKNRGHKLLSISKKAQYIYIYIYYLIAPHSTVSLQKLTGFSANQETPRNLQKPKFHYRTQKRPCFVGPCHHGMARN